MLHSHRPFDLRRGVGLAGAAEQMFFFDPPLAHAVAYEERQREHRLQQTCRRQRRPIPPGKPILVPQPSGEGA